MLDKEYWEGGNLLLHNCLNLAVGGDNCLLHVEAVGACDLRFGRRGEVGEAILQLVVLELVVAGTV